MSEYEFEPFVKPYYECVDCGRQAQAALCGKCSKEYRAFSEFDSPKWNCTTCNEECIGEPFVKVFNRPFCGMCGPNIIRKTGLII